MRNRTFLRFCKGLTYVESLVSILVMGVCLVPVVQTLHSHFGRHNGLTQASRDIACLRDTMESVLNQSHASLLAAATSTEAGGVFSNPTVFSAGASSSCPQARNAYVLRYDPTTVSFATTKDDVLFIKVEAVGGNTVSTLSIAK